MREKIGYVLDSPWSGLVVAVKFSAPVQTESLSSNIKARNHVFKRYVIAVEQCNLSNERDVRISYLATL